MCFLNTPLFLLNTPLFPTRKSSDAALARTLKTTPGKKKKNPAADVTLTEVSLYRHNNKLDMDLSHLVKKIGTIRTIIPAAKFVVLRLRR